ncbi:MAG TPA: aldo/keto reductase [Chthonomonadales bacterium]|nr:aldo/keto reductase [Chthonomonadales bacterium]
MTQAAGLARSSQADGLFTGRYRPGNRCSADMVRVYYSNATWERVRRCRVLDEEWGFTPNQIALAYVLCHPFPVCALIGQRTVAELWESVGPLGIELTAD